MSGRRVKKAVWYSIYVIATEIGMTKIGIAKNPKKRLIELQIGSPATLRLFNYTPTLPSVLATRVEKRCHKKLEEFRRHGEWFEIEPGEAWKCVESYYEAALDQMNRLHEPRAKNLTRKQREERLALKNFMKLNDFGPFISG